MKNWLKIAASLGFLLGTASRITAQDTDLCAARQVADVLPDSSVTAIAFGGVQFEAPLLTPLSLSAIATNNINLRAEPSTYSAIVGGLENGEAVLVLGRNEAGDWLRLEDDGETAWVFARLVNVDGDISTLTVGDTVPSTLNAASGFLLTTGTACEDSANTGLLLQSPLNEPRRVIVNGLPINFNGTVLLKVVDDVTRVLNIDFNSAVTVGGAAIEILSGNVMDIRANGNATPAVAYKFEDVQGLPLDLLPVQVQRPTSYAVNYGLTPCGFLDDDQALTTVPAGEPIEVRAAIFGESDGEALLQQIAQEGQRNLTLDDEPVELWSVRGPNATESGFELHWYWVIFDPQPGTHQLVLTTTNTGKELDDEITCTLEVE